MPDQAGRVAVITGASTGLGFENAWALAAGGASIVLACRDTEAGKQAAERIAGMTGAAIDSDNSKKRPAAGNLSVVRLDLASLASVHEAADEIGACYDRIDLLINNAGVMMTPYRTTADGLEYQLGVNHFGHFALTGLLIGRLLDQPGSRVVTVSSNSHKVSRLDFDDLQCERRYRRFSRYGQTKLANLLFTFELQRRLDAAGAKTTALAAHPGKAKTRLPRYLPLWMRTLDAVAEQPFGHSARMGALATLRAATDPAAAGADYFGPDGRGEQRGYPHVVSAHERAHDERAQLRLWQESERLTGVTFPLSPR